MKKTLTTHDIANELKNDNNANWSWAGALAIAEYLEEWESDTGEEMEFDRVAIRCDFSEYSSLQEWATDYFGGEDKAKEELCDEYMPDKDELSDNDDEIPDDKIKEYINDNGALIEFDGGIIVSSF
jgi:hypothetical protein